jgi:DNA-binding response OmpR family regulator
MFKKGDHMTSPADLPPAIVIVEDEAPIRRLIRNALLKAGYFTLEAGDAARAEGVMRSYTGKIQLVILDIVMPGGGGLDFANQLDVEFPGILILYISGFVESVAVESISRRKPELILTKPFTGSQLVARVRDLLAAGIEYPLGK